MRLLLLFIAVVVQSCSAQCTCNPAAVTTNQGTPPADFTFGALTFTSSPDGCDLTVHCTGLAPLSIGVYYSSTVEGNAPILDVYNSATLMFEDNPVGNNPSSINFQSMRCTNGNWIPYIADFDYLAVNDPTDPSTWIMYNNLFCTQYDVPSTTTLEEVASTTVPATTPTSTVSHAPTTTTSVSAQCPCSLAAMTTNQGAPPDGTTFGNITFTSSSSGCDLTVHCSGMSPLWIGVYYSSTVDGDTPILDANNAAILAYEENPENGQESTIDFQYMRCTNGDWIPYLVDSDYLAENDPSGDPGTWITYNNLFCIQAEASPCRSSKRTLEDDIARRMRKHKSARKVEKMIQN